ncbi:MAG: 4Fe-4S binding protein [Proteobacteria bacterium]|nr:4Fe-4S binding protein [Pseudomonadota bacterium]MBU1687916.1 4Fe-4S binding protein [Pseudomonadota bacterium]
MKVHRKIIEIDQELCDGCGQCVPSCAEGALEIIDGKARMIAEKYCDGLGACLGECPQGALQVIERVADDFDEEAVEELLKEKKEVDAPHPKPITGGCPSAQLKIFQTATPCQAANMPSQVGSGGDSALSHWPVQIRLVPPSAPFLKESDLLVAADCTSVAYPNFHKDFLQGRAVMIGCPKFDDPEGYVRKFQEIFETADLKSITLVIMEVPCCGGMRGIIRQAMVQSGKSIPIREVVIGVRGEITADTSR